MGNKDKSKTKKHVQGKDKKRLGRVSDSALESLGASVQDIDTPSKRLGDLMEDHHQKIKRLNKKLYEAELINLQADLVRMPISTISCCPQARLIRQRFALPDYLCPIRPG